MRITPLQQDAFGTFTSHADPGVMFFGIRPRSARADVEGAAARSSVRFGHAAALIDESRSLARGEGIGMEHVSPRVHWP